MQIKMIRDYGAFKKGKTYDLGQKKTTELLTGGFCVRISSSDEKTLPNKTVPINSKKQKNESQENK